MLAPVLRASQASTTPCRTSIRRARGRRVRASRARWPGRTNARSWHVGKSATPNPTTALEDELRYLRRRRGDRRPPVRATAKRGQERSASSRACGASSTLPVTHVVRPERYERGSDDLHVARPARAGRRLPAGEPREAVRLHWGGSQRASGASVRSGDGSALQACQGHARLGRAATGHPARARASIAARPRRGGRSTVVCLSVDRRAVLRAGASRSS